MKPNPQYIKSLVYKNGWSESEFALELGVSRSMVNRFFNGKRIGGTKFVGCLLRVFPNEPLDKLFFLD
jgi:transcriptional regulator with XRE-family HTH domain